MVQNTFSIAPGGLREQAMDNAINRWNGAWHVRHDHQVILLAALLSICLPSHAKWAEASSRHFVVYSQAKPERVRAFAERLERFDQTMRFVHRQPDPELGPANRLTVYVLGAEDEVAKLARSNSVAGFKVDAITLRELSAGENAIMPLKIRSRRGVNQQQAAELAPLMRTAAAPFANDAAVQAALAEAEFDAHNFEAALAAADRALAVDSKRVEALLYRGRSLAKLAKKASTEDGEAWREIRKCFLTANSLDPEDPRPLIEFYQSFAASG